MDNPITSFIDLTDQFGTRVAALTVRFAGGPSHWAWQWGAEFLVLVTQTVLTYAIWALDLMITQGLFLDVAGSVYQVVLDTIYRYVNPLIIATFAFLFLMARLFIGDKVIKDKKSERITGFELNDNTLADEAFRKKVSNQLANTAILLFITIVAMANPFTLLTKIFGFINWAVAEVAPNSSGANPQIDGVLVPMLQLVNYGDVLSPECNESWSKTLAAGGNVAKLSCLTASEKAATSASAVTFLLSLFAILMVAGFVYFAWFVLMRFTWMLYRMIVHIAVVPWQAALLIANPGSERQKLDAIKDRFLDAAKSLFWLLATVFVAAAVPAAVLGALARLPIPPLVMMLAASILFYYAGKLVNERIGRKWQRKQDGTKVEIKDGTTGWADFRQNNSTGKAISEAFDEAQKASAADLARSSSALDRVLAKIGVSASSTAADAGTQGGAKVLDRVVDDPVLDEAVQTVDLTTNETTTTVKLATGVEGGALVAEDVNDDLGAEGGTSARAFAAAAAAALIAEEASNSGGPATAGIESAFGALAPSPSAAGAGAAAAAAGMVATQAASVDVADDSTGGGRHRADGDGVAASHAHTVDPSDPVTARRQMLEDYYGAVEQMRHDPDTSTEDSTAGPIAKSAESTAFHRIAKAYDVPTASEQDAATARGVTGGSGEFLTASQRLVEWQEYRTLAKSLGMNLEPVADEQDNKHPKITFYTSSEDGHNEVRFRGRDGFGDAI
ncbi:hypothetical protein GS896_25310 [Rhodococcus hoagii]|nr:hypothetical protein [Prescottella equi]MBM4654177.1 hypothetical protein [Prescottella equi]MBM4719649.1 hypothetical protein [Prescottella equi]NKR23448.1 hypothetical protein [Prescottella equi]NKT55940.1 hypothetical protein [Prescottella equi]